MSALAAAALACGTAPDTERGIGSVVSVEGEREDVQLLLVDSPDDPELLTRYCGLSLRLADGERAGRAVMEAVSAADRAVEIAPDSSGARACLARGLERLSLLGGAIAAWEAYLRLAPQASDADDVRERIARLRFRLEDGWERHAKKLGADDPDDDAIREAVEAFPREVRKVALHEVLAEWGAAVRRGDEDAAAVHLGYAERLGRSIGSLTGDTQVADAVSVAKEMLPDSPDRQGLAEAHFSYREGIERIEANDGGALVHVARAGELFAAVGSPAGLSASLRIATLSYNRNTDADLAESVAILSRVAARAEARDYRVLLGEVRWMLGLVAVRQLRFSDGRDAYEKALAAFEASHDAAGGIAVVGLRVELLEKLGEYDEALLQALGILEEASILATGRELDRLHSWVARMVLAAGYPRAAVQLQRHSATRASVRGGADEAFYGFVLIARIQHELDRPDLVEENLRLSREWIAKIDDPDKRRFASTTLALVEARILARQSPMAAIDILEDSVDPADELHGIEVHSILAHSLSRLNRIESAEVELVQGLEKLERVLVDIRSAPSRTSYADLWHEIVERLVHLRFELLGDPHGALSAVERGRARQLREVRKVTHSEHLVADLLDRAPGRTAILNYFVLEDSVLIWCIKRGELEAFSVEIEAAELQRLVDAIGVIVARAPCGGLGGHGATAQRLFDVLVRPAIGSLEGVDRIIFVPDRYLNLVPFAALMDTSNGRMLVESYEIGLAPSATLALVSAQERESSDGVGSLLAVGDPAFDSRRFPYMSTLAGARNEAITIGSHYSAKTILVGGQATMERFLAELDSHDVVHFAGHAIANDRKPMQSSLLLAAAGDNDGVLTAGQLIDLELERTHTVVLAACRSGAGHVSTSEGVMSLARPFIAAGAASVVASLWDVDDSGSVALFDQFHRALADGRSPIGALAIAQRKLLGSETGDVCSPRVWAAFQTYVGSRPNSDGRRAS
ncbi:MAG: CHAT domain-containing protein [bacterium]|nr:CHAT domain-containing protein [bacterium]